MHIHTARKALCLKLYASGHFADLGSQVSGACPCLLWRGLHIGLLTSQSQGYYR